MTLPRSRRSNLLSLPRITACVALGMICTAASAAPDAPTTTVRYGDLNLATDAGTMALYRRLRAAAHRVCDADGTRELKQLMLARSCYEHALSEAVGTLHNERLSSIYRAAGGAGPG
jgi:UrcA family protein